MTSVEVVVEVPRSWAVKRWSFLAMVFVVEVAWLLALAWAVWEWVI